MPDRSVGKRWKHLNDMVGEMLVSDKWFSDWEINRLDEWLDMTHYSRKQGKKIEQIYKQRM